jgi:hypothetical protein
MNRYELKPSANKAHIDIYPSMAKPNEGYVMRIPLREGREMRGRLLAERICAYLNEESERVHGALEDA